MYGIVKVCNLTKIKHYLIPSKKRFLGNWWNVSTPISLDEVCKFKSKIHAECEIKRIQERNRHIAMSYTYYIVERL